jgi:hypothetical protein
MIHIKQPFTTATGWTVLGNDTTNLAASAICLTKGGSLEFDKVDGAADTVFAGAYAVPTANTFPAIYHAPFARGLSAGQYFDVYDRIGMSVYLSALTNVAYSFIRFGASVSHYLEWRFADSTLTAGWSSVFTKIGDCYLTGNGMYLESVIDYVVVGVAFDNQTNALADIKIDSIFLSKNELALS